MIMVKRVGIIFLLSCFLASGAMAARKPLTAADCSAYGGWLWNGAVFSGIVNADLVDSEIKESDVTIKVLKNTKLTALKPSKELGPETLYQMVYSVTIKNQKVGPIELLVVAEYTNLECSMWVDFVLLTSPTVFVLWPAEKGSPYIPESQKLWQELQDRKTQKGRPLPKPIPD